MSTLKPHGGSGETSAAGAWALVALTPVGWFFGALAAAYSHLGDVVDVNQMLAGVLLFAAAPTTAFILAVYAARAGHRSGKIAVMVSGLLLLATIAVTLLYGGWVGLAVAAAVAVLVLAWVLSRRIAVVVSGLVLLATLVFSAWRYGGWVNAAVIAVIAVAAVLVLAWGRSRHKPPPGPDGAKREEESPAASAPPGASERTW
jgi:MFS family permease